MRMLCTATVVATVAWSGGGPRSNVGIWRLLQVAAGDLPAGRRQRKPASAAAGEAGANCPTNPNGSIPVFEKVLKNMNVELPKRP
jgi:hypothetical protein